MITIRDGSFRAYPLPREEFFWFGVIRFTNTSYVSTWTEKDTVRAATEECNVMVCYERGERYGTST